MNAVATNKYYLACRYDGEWCIVLVTEINEQKLGVQINLYILADPVKILDSHRELTFAGFQLVK